MKTELRCLCAGITARVLVCKSFATLWSRFPGRRGRVAELAEIEDADADADGKESLTPLLAIDDADSKRKQGKRSRCDTAVGTRKLSIQGCATLT